jgi:hypothetical protein
MDSPLTDCMMALVIGMFRERALSSPLANFTRGVFRLTLEGIAFSSE